MADVNTLTKTMYDWMRRQERRLSVLERRSPQQGIMSIGWLKALPARGVVASPAHLTATYVGGTPPLAPVVTFELNSHSGAYNAKLADRVLSSATTALFKISFGTAFTGGEWDALVAAGAQLHVNLFGGRVTGISDLTLSVS